MMMMTTSITSGQEKQIVRFGSDAVEKALKEFNLEKDAAQLVIENGGEFQSHIYIAASNAIREFSNGNKYADEEVSSSYVYPQEYTVQDLTTQINILCKHFPQISPDLTLQFIANGLPQLPEHAEGWMIVPKWEKIASSYPEAVQKILDAIKSTRNFYNYRNGEIDPRHLRVHTRTEKYLNEIAVAQPGDFLILAVQFGVRHRGKSVRRTRETFIKGEFGLGSFAVGCMALTHPKRYVRWKELDTDCPGDEFKPDDDDSFSKSPFFSFGGDKLKFDTYDVSDAHGYFGSVSAFVPQQ